MVPKPKATVPTVVNDFLVLPLQIPRIASFPQPATHYLYVRQNAPKVLTETTPRELFLVNVPIDATETHLRSLFANQLGGARVEEVKWEGERAGKGLVKAVAPVKESKKRKRGDHETVSGMEEEEEAEVGRLPTIWERDIRRSGGSAVVVFVDRDSAQLTLKEAKRAIKSKKEIFWGEGVEGKIPPLGEARYKAHHTLRYPDHDVLRESVDSFMAHFAAKEEARAKALAQLRSEPDADGFITITRGGRQGPGREEEAKAKAEELKKREKSRIKDDFYRFQMREKKKQEAKDLVKSFEEDRRRVEEMKKRKGKIRPE